MPCAPNIGQKHNAGQRKVEEVSDVLHSVNWITDCACVQLSRERVFRSKASWNLPVFAEYVEESTYRSACIQQHGCLAIGITKGIITLCDYRLDFRNMT